MFVRSNCLGAVLDEAAIELPKTSAVFTRGCVVAWDRSANQLMLATATTDNHGADAYFGTSKGDYATGESVANVVPFGLNQCFIIDCTNATATTQVGHRYHLTDELTLNNSGTDGTSALDIFEVLKVVGATTDKKLLVRVISPAGQVVA